MAQNIEIRSARRSIGLIGAVSCLAAIGMVSLSGQALAHAGGGGHGGGGHGGGGGGHFGGGHFGGHGGFAHGYGYGHGGYGGFYRGGYHYYYNAYGVLVQDCCYVAPVVVAPFGVYVP